MCATLVCRTLKSDVILHQKSGNGFYDIDVLRYTCIFSYSDEIDESDRVNLVTILSRITNNFGVQNLSTLPKFQCFLSALCTMGR